LNYLAGWLSDRSGRRKVFVLAGYGFSTLAKTILLASTSIAGFGAFRVIERLGKGFRGPPRDAWLSSVADAATQGHAFGVHKAMDKAGAVLGPVLAYGLLSWLGESAGTYRALFWLAFVPALLSIVVLALMKAHAAGFSVTDTVLLYALFNAVCVVAAPLVGSLGDAIGRSRIVSLGYGLFGAINVALVWASQSWQLIALFALHGVFYATEDSQSKAFIADLEPDRRATAVGACNVVTGVLYLPASLVAGALWASDPRWAFGLAAVLTAAAMALFGWLQPARAAAR
jgi:MFS family permease